MLTDALAALRPLLQNVIWLAVVGLAVLLGGQVLGQIKANPPR
jgi:hypothetical protein